MYPALIDVNPVPQATDSHNWDAFIVNGQSLNNGYRSSHTNGDATSFVEWRLPLEAGNWSLEVTHVKADDAGIMTFSLDGADAGSVDGYSASIEQNARESITSITVGDVRHAHAPRAHRRQERRVQQLLRLPRLAEAREAVGLQPAHGGRAPRAARCLPPT